MRGAVCAPVDESESDCGQSADTDWGLKRDSVRGRRGDGDLDVAEELCRRRGDGRGSGAEGRCLLGQCRRVNVDSSITVSTQVSM